MFNSKVIPVSRSALLISFFVVVFLSEVKRRHSCHVDYSLSTSWMFVGLLWLFPSSRNIDWGYFNLLSFKGWVLLLVSVSLHLSFKARGSKWWWFLSSLICLNSLSWIVELGIVLCHLPVIWQWKRKFVEWSIWLPQKTSDFRFLILESVWLTTSLHSIEDKELRVVDPTDGLNS